MSYPLSNWINFYEIVGSSAGALTGLQFVVMALISQSNMKRDQRAVQAFGTPTVVQFCVCLLISAVMSAPWPSIHFPVYCLSVVGVFGVAYGLRVLFHARAAEYNPDLEDWFWYTGLPLTAYTGLIAAAAMLWRTVALPPFLIAAIDLIFLFTGIHNAWDTVTYIAMQMRRESGNAENANAPPADGA